MESKSTPPNHEVHQQDLPISRNRVVLHHDQHQVPAKVADAMNILRHEKIGRWISPSWVQNSFVSKYLHFHFPEVVPVFDNYAYNAAWKLAGPSQEDAEYDNRWNSDYAYFCRCLLQIINKLQSRGVKSPSLKIIDVLLYATRG